MPLLLDQAAHSQALKRAIAALPWAPRLVIIDTQSQTFSGDENAATEVSAYYRRLSSDLREPTGATVVVIHHTGHNATERPRGSSAILANTDFVLSITRESEDGMSTILEVTKQKDGDKIAPIPFVLERMVVDIDEDGDEISSLVASHHDNVDAITTHAAERLSRYEAAIMDCFGESSELPDSFLRQALYAAIDGPYDTKKKAYKRAILSLQTKGLIELTAKGVWGRVKS